MQNGTGHDVKIPHFNLCYEIHLTHHAKAQSARSSCIYFEITKMQCKCFLDIAKFAERRYISKNENGAEPRINCRLHRFKFRLQVRNHYHGSSETTQSVPLSTPASQLINGISSVGVTLPFSLLAS